MTRHWPVAVSLLVLWVTTAVLSLVSLRGTNGHLVYALDDPYIHMAMAKNLAEHGVLGVTRYGFTSSSSSLLWTLTLAAAYWLTGVRDVTPFVLNVLMATLELLLVDGLFRRAGAGPIFRLIILLLVTFVTPVPTLIFVGQEHLLHGLATVAFVFVAAETLAADPTSDIPALRLVVLAVGLPLVRYEAFFVVVLVTLLLICRGRLTSGVCLLAAAVFPLAVYGFISSRMGSFWVPNSVLLKGTIPEAASLEGLVRFLATRYSTLMGLPPVLFLFDAALMLYLVGWTTRRWERARIMLAIFLALTPLQVAFAQPGAFWLYRYEAYLVTLGLVAIGLRCIEYADRLTLDSLAIRRAFAPVILAAVFMLASPLFDRSFKALVHVPRAVANIYEQQYQMGLFLRRFYEGTPIAMNDIGAVNYLADVRCLDLWGLASLEVAERRWRNRYHTDDVEEVADRHGTRVAIIYDHWFDHPAIGGVPARWIRVGQWTVRNRLVLGGSTVSFYAVQPSEQYVLAAHLRAFQSELPKTVVARHEPTQ